MEYKTIFHDHNERNPLDPHNRRTATAGCSLAPSNVSEGSVLYDGTHHIKTLPFGPSNIPFGERCPSKIALNDYEVNDTILHPRVRLGCKVSEERFKFTSNRKYHDMIPRSPQDKRPWRNCETSEKFLKHKEFLEECDDTSHVGMQKGRTKLKHGKPKVSLDTSSYKRSRRALGNVCAYGNLPSLDPTSINKQIRSNPFHNILTMPRAHGSTALRSKIGETLDKYA